MHGLGRTVAVPLLVMVGGRSVGPLRHHPEVPPVAPGNLALWWPAPGGRVVTGQGLGKVRRCGEATS